MTNEKDLKNNAIKLLVEDISLNIDDVLNEDIPKEEDIRLIREITKEDHPESWTGYFTSDLNSEQIYEVKYLFHIDKFFVTMFKMDRCTKYNSDHLY